MRTASSAHFLTFTYEDDRLSYDIESKKETLVKSHYKEFMYRLRYHDRKIHKSQIKYYAVGEYGSETNRPHYHAIMFNLHPSTFLKLADIWGHGHVHCGDVTGASVNYVAGYCVGKHDHEGTTQKPFAFISKGIGKDYLTPQMISWHKRNLKMYTRKDGVYGPLPRIYKDILFTSAQKARAVDKMDKITSEKYATEIERLSKLHEDPQSYYQEKVYQAYARVRVSKGTI